MKEKNQIEDVLGKVENMSSKIVSKCSYNWKCYTIFLFPRNRCALLTINSLFDFCTFDISHIFGNQLCMEVGLCKFCHGKAKDHLAPPLLSLTLDH